MLNDLEKNTVIVLTGVTGLIGKEIFKSLIDFELTIIATYYKSESVCESLKKLVSTAKAQVEFCQLDIASQDSSKMLITHLNKKYQRVDILIHAVGAKLKKAGMMTGVKEMQYMADINLLGVFYFTNQILKMMLRQANGKVIFIGSYAGQNTFPGQSFYAATKASLNIWVKSMVHEVGKYNIHINIVSPGALKSNDDTMYSNEDVKNVINRIALGRLGCAADVANSVLWLCSSYSSYVNGANIAVDGGANF